MVVPLVRSLSFGRILYLFALDTGIFEMPMASWLDADGSHNWGRLREASGPLATGYYKLDYVRSEWVVNSAARIPFTRADWRGPYFRGWRGGRIFQGELTREEAEAALAEWRAQT